MKNNKKQIKTLWGALFDKAPSTLMMRFTSGRDVYPVDPADYKLLPYDLWGSKSHCVMLYQQNIIDEQSAKKIICGLQKIEELAEKKQFILDSSKEDIHTNVESWLVENIGITYAGKLHTARSRNDQSSLDVRLYLRDQTLIFIENIIVLSEALIKQAKKYKTFVMPGFSHYRHAMLTTFGHVLLAYATMIVRDGERFIEWYKLHNFNPLGNSVGYGTMLPINRQTTTKFLAFDACDINSLDTITNRWEAESDLAYAISILMNHFSSLAQTLILFSTSEFDMVQLDDQFSTGSSIMPQKKNPDSLEVMKAKASLVSGYLQALLSLGKAHCIGYNRDSQWSKYVIFDIIDECLFAPHIVKEIIASIKVNKKTMLDRSYKGFVGTTSLLEQVVNTYHLPLREAKMILEKAVKYSQKEEDNQGIVTYKAFKQALKESKIDIHVTEKQLQKWQDPLNIIEHTTSWGGPGQKSIDTNVDILKKKVAIFHTWLQEKITQKEKAIDYLNTSIKSLIHSL